MWIFLIKAFFIGEQFEAEDSGVAGRGKEAELDHIIIQEQHQDNKDKRAID